MFRLKVARSAAEIEDLRFAWESLHSPGLSMFQSYRWNRLAAQAFAAREQPYFVFCENDCGVAMIPSVIDIHSKTISLAGERLFDYRDYLSVGDNTPLLCAWQHLAELNLPLSITAINRLNGEWNRLPKTYFCGAPKVESRVMCAADFAKQHSRAFSRLRKLQRMGVRLSQYAGDSGIVRQIYERRAGQVEQNELFRDPQRIEFMVEICRASGRRCEVFALEHGSDLVAGLITFLDRDFRRFYTTSYHRAWARYSPGVTLMFEVARLSLEQGLNVDLMTGEQPYKLRMASGSQKLFQVNATAAELRRAFVEPERESIAA